MKPAPVGTRVQVIQGICRGEIGVVTDIGRSLEWSRECTVILDAPSPSREVCRWGNLRPAEDDDPQCVCGVYRSEHALCGCPDGFERRR